MKLFAIYLGGRAPKANTELHDVVFVAGETIEATYGRLKELWFGSMKGLHIDSWMEVAAVDGFKVTLSKDRSRTPEKLYFVNLGAYSEGEFTELHANAIVVATSENEVKSRAKRDLLRGKDLVHKDDLFDIDDCISIDEIDGYFVQLERTGEPDNMKPNNGYLLLPE